MGYHPEYDSPPPERAEVDASPGALVLEFGADGCGFCQASQAAIETAFSDHADITHLKIADGPGRPLGRSFKVKLWPTLIFLQNGSELSRLIRPTDADDIRRALQAIATM